MKKNTLFAVIPLLTLFTIRALGGAAIQPVGTATVTLTAFAQKYLDETVSTKIHYTPTSTNTTTVIRSKGTNTVIDSDSIISLLENSFRTNFAVGATLLIQGTGSFTFLVADSTGTNVLLDAGSVLSISANASVQSGREKFIEINNRAGTSSLGHDTEASVEYATLTYNDAALTTKDGTHTNFQLSGILHQLLSASFGTSAITESLGLRGAGVGTVQGKSNVILKGTVTAALSGPLVVE